MHSRAEPDFEQLLPFPLDNYLSAGQRGKTAGDGP
jgi:hypothetical protein